METTQTRRIKLSELDSLKSTNPHGYGYYTVKRSDHPNCIYKLLKNVESLTIGFNTYNHHRPMLFGDYEISASFNETRNVSNNSGREEIEIVDDKATVKGFQDSHSYTYIHLRSGKTVLKIQVPYNMKGELIENADETFSVSFFGVVFPLSHWENIYNRNKTDRTFLDYYNSCKNYQVVFTKEQREKYLRKKLSDTNYSELEIGKVEGVTKTFAVIKPFYEKVMKDDIISSLAFKIATDMTKNTVNNVKFSVAYNALFGNITTEKEFVKQIDELGKILETTHVHYRHGFKNYLEKILDSLPEARNIKKAALKKKSTGAFNKIMDDHDFVKIDEKRYPLTFAAVHNGDIPLGTFFRKSGESYFLYNDNWELWEQMLKLHPEIAKSIAAEASKRVQYEKDIMSYFQFTLHTLPEYLQKMTGKKWTGIPKLVSSANELEPPKEGENGVAKSRSALTPIPDNEKCEVVVPYVSMKVHGYMTTYCYALDYNLLSRGFSFKGNVVTKDFEASLNGRDDYGLMFYTLTGSGSNAGYPTFFIIFERLKDSTRVHFHRTHPMRSKQGDYNPVHNWTTGCYKWMIGNVNFERIKAQQGDLAFVEIDPIDFTEAQEVNKYDNHVFETPVKFLPYTKKDNQNVLGYVSLPKATQLIHNEHMNRTIPAGTYEIRQCRSWEANPRGIWSLRID